MSVNQINIILLKHL